MDLEALKRQLLDLDGDETWGVLEATAGPTRLSDPGRRLRGSDWPKTGLTMIGKERLDDLQGCVETLVAEHVSGDLIECGVWRGGACILMRGILNELGQHHRTVYVADSFQGFRSAHAEEYSFARYNDVLAVSESEVRANFERFGLLNGVEFVPGYFEDTLRRLRGHEWALIRSDADTRSATLMTLEALEPDLESGGFVIVDDYRFMSPVREAVDTYRAQRGIIAPLENCDSWNAVRWRA